MCWYEFILNLIFYNFYQQSTNTNITLGVYREDDLLLVSRLATDTTRMRDQYASDLLSLFQLHGVDAKQFSGAIVSSVVPTLDHAICEAVEMIVGRKPLIVGPGTKTGINIRIDNPAQLGADLLVGAVAAVAKVGSPCVIWDLGTATTVSVVGAGNTFLGGAIMPGIKTSLKSLVSNASLLHDIGKSVDHEMEGSHIQIGVDLCRKYKESPLIINAVEAHHGDVEPESLIACIVQAADTISAARPGARRETLETYSNRLKQLEDISNGFKGVDKSFAIQAGREIRVMVVPEQVSDADMVLMARDISKKIESEMEYPGQIKVNVIRESRVTDYAR